MAGERILVVDDNPLNLKILGLALRAERYDVHSAGGAQEALDLLNTLHPDLMLIDIRMPGMDGLELTRRIKADARTRDIVAVALTASPLKADEERAHEAGCDGFLTKPINTRTIGARIRAYLDSRAAPSPPADSRAEPSPAEPSRAEPPAEPSPAAPPPAAPPPSRAADAAHEPSALAALQLTKAEMDNLRRRFLSEGKQKCSRLLASVDDVFDAAEAGQLLHQWVGAAGLLGYTEISDLSAKIEELLRIPPWTTAHLRDLLNDLLSAFGEPSEAAEAPLPDSVVKELAGKGIALVGFGEQEADYVCAALERVNARPRLFEVSEMPNSTAIQDCQAVMVHVRPETMGSSWLTVRAEPPSVPLVLLGLREHVLALDRSVQTRASELLVDQWQPEEALLRLSFALSRPAALPARVRESSEMDVAQKPAEPQAGRPEVLVADDDFTTLTLVRSTLENYGMNCHVATNGPASLQMIRDLRPSAVVLDVNMPGMSGYEVLAAVRADALPVRVLLLTARGNETDVVQGFRLGADDYVVKPFSALELVFRVKRLLSGSAAIGATPK